MFYINIFIFQGAIYGMAQSIPDRSIVSEIACGFFDAYYSTKKLDDTSAATKDE